MNNNNILLLPEDYFQLQLSFFDIMLLAQLREWQPYAGSAATLAKEFRFKSDKVEIALANLTLQGYLIQTKEGLLLNEAFIDKKIAEGRLKKNWTRPDDP